MIAFFAATPYQLINVLNIYNHFHDNENADIYLLNFATDMKKFLPSLKKIGVFKKVISLDELAMKGGKISVIRDYIFPEKHFFQQFFKTKYDIVYTTTIGDRNNVFYNIALKKNPELELRFYDEGAGIYITGFYENNDNILKLLKIKKWKEANQNFDKILAYIPNMVHNEAKGNRVKIPPINKENIVLNNQLKDVFKYSFNPQYENCNLIYFDQCFSRYISEQEYKKKYRFDAFSMLSHINTVYNKDQILLKKHPVTVLKEEECRVEIDKGSGMPWEIIQLYHDFEDKLLVTINSTTVLTPKLLFNKEPYIILLAKLIKNENLCDQNLWDEKSETFFTSFFDMYKNKNKVFIPNNFKELYNILEEVKKKQQLE